MTGRNVLGLEPVENFKQHSSWGTHRFSWEAGAKFSGNGGLPSATGDPSFQSRAFGDGESDEIFCGCRMNSYGKIQFLLGQTIPVSCEFNEYLLTSCLRCKILGCNTNKLPIITNCLHLRNV